MSENVHGLLLMSIDVVASSGTTASLFIAALSVLVFVLHAVCVSVSVQEQQCSVMCVVSCECLDESRREKQSFTLNRTTVSRLM